MHTGSSVPVRPATRWMLNAWFATWQGTALLATFLVLITAAVFSPGLGGGFLFDDYPNIVNNKAIQVGQFDIESLRAAAGAYKGIVGRPLATLSFALDYRLYGTDPWGYKLSSLLVHLVNSIAVFLLVLQLARLPRLNLPSSKFVALAVALAWAIHPIQISTVLYVVQRMEMLSLLFVLLSLMAYLAGRNRQIEGRNGWPWMGATVLFGILGLLAKETAALLPLYALCLELTVLRFQAADQRISRFWKLAYASCVAIGVAFFVSQLPRHFDPALYANRDFTVGERLLTQLRVLPMYLGQMLLPLPASMPFYYDDLEVSQSLWEPITTALGGALLATLLAVTVLLRKRAPLFSLGLLWFFAAHFLTSNVIPLELAFEHRNYFALLGVLLAIADLVMRVPTADGPAIKRFAVTIVLVMTAALGAIRAATWGEPLLLASQMAALNPASARASIDLAARFAGLSGDDPSSPMYPLAIAEFERGAKLPNASPLSEQGLILLAAQAGKPQQATWWNQLDEKLNRRPIGAQERSAVSSLMARRYEGIAIDDHRLSKTYAVFVERSGSPPSLCLQYADFAHVYLKDEALSAQMYVRAINGRPGDAAFAASILTQLVSQGRTQQADAVYRRIQELGLLSAPAGSKPLTGAAARRLDL
jgi:hypothetical protein